MKMIIYIHNDYMAKYNCENYYTMPLAKYNEDNKNS